MHVVPVLAMESQTTYLAWMSKRKNLNRSTIDYSICGFAISIQIDIFL